MASRRRLGLGLLLVLFASGCGDTPATMYRRILNSKYELIDNLSKVVNEESAVVFDEFQAAEFKKLLNKQKTDLERWVQENLWKSIKFDPKKPGSKETAVNAAKAEILAAIDTYVEVRFDYMKQEVGNKQRIAHEINRLNALIAKLEEKGEKTSKLRTIANPAYFDAIVLETILDVSDPKELKWQFKYGQ